MSSTEPSATTPNRAAGKTLLGVAVHVLGMVFGVIGAGIVYLVAQNEFTTENARNALNWQILFLGVFVVMTGAAFTLGMVLDGVVIIAVLTIFVIIALDFVFCLIATINAVRGTAWTYPIAPAIV